MAEVRAADLPEGSVLAHGLNAWIRVAAVGSCERPWYGTSSSRSSAGDEHIDRLLADGAEVLRHGYGDA